jgi:hypothetical protein
MVVTWRSAEGAVPDSVDVVWTTKPLGRHVMMPILGSNMVVAILLPVFIRARWVEGQWRCLLALSGAGAGMEWLSDSGQGLDEHKRVKTPWPA